MRKIIFSKRPYVLLSFFLLLSSLMLSVTLYPYNFSPKATGPTWLTEETGIYFNGGGIAYTKPGSKNPVYKQVSVELLLLERPGSKNWGPREIFSFYDGKAKAPLLIGQWAGSIFLYSRFELHSGIEWYKFFRSTKRLLKGKPQLLTVTFGYGEKKNYINGELVNTGKIITQQASNVSISGRIILGNSPVNKKGWWGEIRGLAIYDRILSQAEIKRHTTKSLLKGLDGLSDESGAQRIYTFAEGKGNTIESMTENKQPLFIPAKKVTLPETLFHFPPNNLKSTSPVGLFLTRDFWANIFFLFTIWVPSDCILENFSLVQFLYFSHCDCNRWGF